MNLAGLADPGPANIRLKLMLFSERRLQPRGSWPDCARLNVNQLLTENSLERGTRTGKSSEVFTRADTAATGVLRVAETQSGYSCHWGAEGCRDTEWIQLLQG